jgi:hypothetical protein
MTWPELAEACVDAINHPERSAGEPPLITLVWTGKCPFPRRGWPRAKRLLCVNPAGERVYHYDATNVLAAMAAHGLIKVAGATEMPFPAPSDPDGVWRMIESRRGTGSL